MNKESIVFYKDWWIAIKELPEDIQHHAITAVMDYAFMGEEPKDSMLRFATAQIRMFINRDRARYEEICERRREAIKKRWDKQKNTSDTKEYKSIQVNTTQYHNDNENGNDNGNDNENGNETNKFVVDVDRYKSRTRDSYGDYDDATFLSEFFAPQKRASHESLLMQMHISMDEMQKMAEEVVNEWRVTEQKHSNYNDAARHLISSIRIKVQSAKHQSSSNLGIGEYRDSQGCRRFGESDVIVPDSAPPRPSAAHWWSEASNRWEKQI